MSKQISGKQFVLAIIALLDERHLPCVSFDPSTYDDWNDIPYCQALQYTVDTVAPSKTNSDCITMSICREDGFMTYSTFDGTENEDFDYLFHEIYYYQYTDLPEELEADEWLHNFLEKRNHSVKKKLIESIKTIFRRVKNHVTLSKPWTDPESGHDYDMLQFGEADWKQDCFLVDSWNGASNPTMVTLTSLTASELLGVLRDVIKQENTEILNDYDECVAKGRIAEWVNDAVANMAESREAFSMTRLDAACKYIQETLTEMLETSPQRSLRLPESSISPDFDVPYMLELDSFQGLIPETVHPFSRFVVRKGYEGRIEITPIYDDDTMTDINPDHADPIVFGGPYKGTVLCSPQYHHVIPDDSIFLLEKLVQACHAKYQPLTTTPEHAYKKVHE